ncbi:MAG: Tar ligand binding domain-containing protein [Castellaniella sp.]|nr:Tar ligand binding domain-containing protein [Castellaniella sp.]
MQSGGKSLIGALKVRTSLILVLVFFFFMLISGALLGVVSLKMNNDALREISADDEAVGLLDDSIDRYRTIQVLMGRTLGSIVVNSDLANSAILSEWATDSKSGGTSGLSDSSRALIAQVEQRLGQAREALDRFRATAEEHMNEGEQGRQVEQIIRIYAQLLDKELPPVLAQLKAGNIEQYDALQSGSVGPVERQFEQAVQALKQHQQELTDQAMADEAAHLRLVILIVGVSMGVALLFAVAAYLFLQRVVLRPLREAGRHFDRIAAGDLTEAIQVPSRNEIGVLYLAMQRMQESLVRMVSTVRNGVGEIRLGSQEIFAGNTDLSSRTEQQAASLQQTAASMEQLASTVRQNSDNAAQADQLAKTAADVAQRGGTAVSSVAETMAGITQSSSKIAEIVSVIDGIAFQTNILALNAAVEAARAGEQGKGFAVVAGEVRSLAQRSSQAAKEIKGLIDDSVVRVREGSERVQDAGRIMGEIVQSVQGVTAIMNEISSASREQADGISQINSAVNDMDHVVQQNAALVQEAASAAGSLQEQAEHLSEAVAAFRLHEGGQVIEVQGGQLGYTPRAGQPALALGQA